MNSKLFLGLILLSAILMNLFFSVKEGNCSFEDTDKEPEFTGGPSSTDNSLQKKGAPVKNARPTKDSCQNATIIENTENSKVAEEKLNELKNIVKKTMESIKKNKKNISDNKKNQKALENAVASDDEGGDDGGAEDPCESYPEAC